MTALLRALSMCCISLVSPEHIVLMFQLAIQGDLFFFIFVLPGAELWPAC